MIPPPMSSSRPVLSDAKRIAACTLVSRVTGLARDVLLAQAFALSWVQDAFSYAFQIPNLFRRLFGEGAMAPVFVPTFTRTLENEGRPAAWRLLAGTLGLMTAALAAVIVAIEMILLGVWLLAPADPARAEARRLLLALTGLMLPFMLPICVLALLSAILNCLGSFVPAAAAPILLNLAMIAGLAWIGPWLAPGDLHAQVYIVAGLVLVGGVLQLLYIWPALRRAGVQVGFRVAPRDPHVARMLKLLPPVALGQGVLAFGVFLDAQICTALTHVAGTPEQATWLGVTFAYPLAEGALSAVTIAQRLYQFPLGVLAISLATAALPAFSRFAARQEWPAWTAEVQRTLRLAVFEGLLAGVMMIVLAEPIVRFLFEYGRFDAADTQRTAVVLRWFGFGLWAFCAQHMVLRAFYSVGDVRTPLRLAMAALPLSVVLNLTLVWFAAIRESAFALSSCLSSALTVLIGAVLLTRRTGRLILDAAVGAAVLRMLVAAGVTGAAAEYLRRGWPAPDWGSGWGVVVARGFATLGLLAVSTGVFLLVARLLGLSEVGALLARRRHATAAPADEA